MAAKRRAAGFCWLSSADRFLDQKRATLPLFGCSATLIAPKVLLTAGHSASRWSGFLTVPNTHDTGVVTLDRAITDKGLVIRPASTSLARWWLAVDAAMPASAASTLQASERPSASASRTFPRAGSAYSAPTVDARKIAAFVEYVGRTCGMERREPRGSANRSSTRLFGARARAVDAGGRPRGARTR